MCTPVPRGLLLWQPMVIFFPKQHAARFSASILPFILCESITETKQDTVVHRRAQIIPTSPSLHKHTSPSAHTHTHTTNYKCKECYSHAVIQT